jgi:hypothetical protein
MAVIPDPRTPYHEEPHIAPPRSMMDMVARFLMVVIAALTAVVFIWFLYATLVWPPPISVDPNAKPTVETQPITPPAPVPATRPAPTP